MQQQLWTDNAPPPAVIDGDLSQYRTGIPLRKLAQPDDIANTVSFYFRTERPKLQCKNSGRWRSYTWGLKLTSAQQYTEIKEQIFLKIEKENTNEYSKDCKLQHAPSARIYSKQNKLAIAYQSCCFIGS